MGKEETDNLIRTVKGNDLAGAKAALAAGGDPNFVNDSGGSATMWACYGAKDTSMVQWLVSSGGNPLLHSPKSQSTALHFAARNASGLSIVKYLVALGIDLHENLAGDRPDEVAEKLALDPKTSPADAKAYMDIVIFLRGALQAEAAKIQGGGQAPTMDQLRVDTQINRFFVTNNYPRTASEWARTVGQYDTQLTRVQPLLEGNRLDQQQYFAHTADVRTQQVAPQQQPVFAYAAQQPQQQFQPQREESSSRRRKSSRRTSSNKVDAYYAPRYDAPAVPIMQNFAPHQFSYDYVNGRSASTSGVYGAPAYSVPMTAAPSSAFGYAAPSSYAVSSSPPPAFGGGFGGVGGYFAQPQLNVQGYAPSWEYQPHYQALYQPQYQYQHQPQPQPQVLPYYGGIGAGLGGGFGGPSPVSNWGGVTGYGGYGGYAGQGAAMYGGGGGAGGYPGYGFDGSFHSSPYFGVTGGGAGGWAQTHSQPYGGGLPYGAFY